MFTINSNESVHASTAIANMRVLAVDSCANPLKIIIETLIGRCR